MSQIKFCIRHQVQFGQGVYLACSQTNWKVDESCRMSCIKCNRWELVFLITDEQLKYKYVIADYDNPSIYTQIWEGGSNRNLVNSKSNRSQTKKDLWEKRMISLKLMALNKNSLAIIIGSFPVLKNPIQMKLLDKQSQIYFKASFYIDITYSNQVIEFQYYMLIKDPTPTEFISTPITLGILERNQKICQRISFYRIALC